MLQLNSFVHKTDWLLAHSLWKIVPSNFQFPLEPHVGITWERVMVGTNCVRDCCNNWSEYTLEFQFLFTLSNILVHLQPDMQRVQVNITNWPLTTPTSLSLFLSQCIVHHYLGWHSCLYAILIQLEVKDMLSSLWVEWTPWSASSSGCMHKLS